MGSVWCVVRGAWVVCVRFVCVSVCLRNLTMHAMEDNMRCVVMSVDEGTQVCVKALERHVDGACDVSSLVIMVSAAHVHNHHCWFIGLVFRFFFVFVYFLI